MAQTAHTGSFGPLLGSCAGLEGSLTRVIYDHTYDHYMTIFMRTFDNLNHVLLFVNKYELYAVFEKLHKIAQNGTNLPKIA